MRGGFFRTFTVLLALCAMSLRAVLPAGYMLASNDGQLVVTICGGASMALDLGKPAPSKQLHHDAPCPYAAAAQAFASPPNAPPISTPTTFVALDAEPQIVRPGLGLAAPPPPATGPPILT